MSEQLTKNQNSYKNQSKWKIEQQLKKLQRLENKDLEVLNILKENIVECVGDSAGNEYLKLLLHKFGNEEEFDKVKKFLEE